MNYFEESLKAHERYKGKLSVVSKMKIENKDDLSIAYTPGVAQPCIEIHKNPENVYRYTSKGNFVAVVTDGSAVLGLGNIGAAAAIPVMEGKCALFKEFADVDAIPICIDSQDDDVIVETVRHIAPTLGGINLEDIAAPRCFAIEKRLQEELDIPVFHDDQHGTAIVVCSALINALKVVGKELGEVKVVVNGAGAAGTAISRMLMDIGIRHLTVCDRFGILNRQEPEKLNPSMLALAQLTNEECLSGTLADALKGADVFVGVSAPGIVSREMVASMAKDAIVFPMANPNPEITPDEAKAGGARIVGTGRSDYPNQINNVLAFPGLFRGALDARAARITEGMKVAAAFAIASLIPEDERGEENIIPSPFCKEVAPAVAKAVREAWEKENR